MAKFSSIGAWIKFPGGGPSRGNEIAPATHDNGTPRPTFSTPATRSTRLRGQMFDSKYPDEVEHIFKIDDLAAGGSELSAAVDAHQMPDPSEGYPLGYTIAFWSSPLMHAHRYATQPLTVHP